MLDVSRREFLKVGTAGVLWAAGVASVAGSRAASVEVPPPQPPTAHTQGHGGNMMIGDVDPNHVNQFDPTAMLDDWDYGNVSTLPNGQTLREYELFAGDKEIEIAP